LVVIGGVTAWRDDAPGVELGVDGVEKDLVAQTGVTGDGIDDQIGIVGAQLEQQGSGRDFFAPVGGQEIAEQGDAETTLGIG
jgi:hypothetical protein